MSAQNHKTNQPFGQIINANLVSYVSLTHSLLVPVFPFTANENGKAIEIEPTTTTTTLCKDETYWRTYNFFHFFFLFSFANISLYTSRHRFLYRYTSIPRRISAALHNTMSICIWFIFQYFFNLVRCVPFYLSTILLVPLAIGPVLEISVFDFASRFFFSLVVIQINCCIWLHSLYVPFAIRLWLIVNWNEKFGLTYAFHNQYFCFWIPQRTHKQYCSQARNFSLKHSIDRLRMIERKRKRKREQVRRKKKNEKKRMQKNWSTYTTKIS